MRNTDLCAQAVLSNTWRQKAKLTHNALPHKNCSQKRDRCRLSNKQLTTHMKDSHHGKGCSGARKTSRMCAHTNLTHCAKAGRTWEDAACSSCRHGSLKYRPKAWPSTPDTPIFHSASEGQRTPLRSLSHTPTGTRSVQTAEPAAVPPPRHDNKASSSHSPAPAPACLCPATPPPG